MTDVTEIVAKGHSWDEPIFNWNGFTAATAAFTCTEDISHKEVRECIITSRITKQATGTEKGAITYTATAEIDDKIYTDTKTQATSKIAEENIGLGTLQTEVNVAENVPTVVIDGLTPEIIKPVLTEKTYKEIEAGENVIIRLEITNINNTVNKDEQAMVENCLKEMVDAFVKNDSELVSSEQVKTGIMYLDLSLYKKVGNNADIKLYNTNGSILTIEVEIPDEFRLDETEKTYTVIRIHEDESGNTVVGALPTLRSGDKIRFKKDRFSTYAIVYTQKDLEAEIHVDSVLLNQEEVRITEKNGTVELMANFVPEEASNKNVTWSSSNTDVATVDENGKVTAVGNGTVVITVTTIDGAKAADCTVTVEFTADDNGGNNGGSNDGINPALPENGGKDGPNKAPQTGDSNNIWLWIIYLLVSLGVFVAVLAENRRKKDKDSYKP